MIRHNIRCPKCGRFCELLEGFKNYNYFCSHCGNTQKKQNRIAVKNYPLEELKISIITFLKNRKPYFACSPSSIIMRELHLSKNQFNRAMKSLLHDKPIIVARYYRKYWGLR